MKLLFLNSVPSDVFGGMENWIGLIAEGLVKRGHKAHIAGRTGSEFLRRTRVMSPTSEILELDISGDFNPITIAKLNNFIRSHDIEAVVANFNKDIRLGGLATAWNADTKLIWSAGLDLVGDGIAHRVLTPRLVDAVITPSAALKSRIASHGTIPESIIEVIPIGIGEPVLSITREEARSQLRDRCGLPSDCLVAVTSGRFVNQKGHVYLVEAATELVRRFSNLRFLWLGNGPLEGVLRDKLQQTGLTDHVIFAGMLDQFGLELAGSDIMLHPSIEEPFGIVLLEGMRAGLPIVASRVGGIPEVVEEGVSALLVEPCRPDLLAAAAGDLLNDGSKLEKFGQAGLRRWQQHFSLALMIDRVEDFLGRVVAGGVSCG
ncbi:MAG: glycosyltransferase family 4 protein [Candidatus Zixiibacteriota bacterium]|nr:MAG: glycosyltransferase family 4 protein [candidate division Zixibacteria bacterium]